VQGSVQKSGSLPFTGLSLTAFAIVGLLLVATGVVLYRRANSSKA
jgi:LPXTG-motif cell wall-anchored protein